MSIILNISGKIFKVSSDVICKSGLFSGMLMDCKIDGEIIVDRSAKLFKHVYAYLLDDKYPYPKKYYSELDYYLVSYDIDLLYDPHKKCAEESERIKNLLYMALDRVVELSFDLDRQCKYPGCNKGCDPTTFTCYSHRGECCHLLSENDQYGGKKICKNEIYGSIPYCDDHILNHQYDLFF